MALSVVFPTVYHLIHEPGVSAFYALAASLMVADFGGILFLVANAVKAIKSKKKDDAWDATRAQNEGKGQGKHLSTKELDDLKALVLYMGLAAGAAVGILVGIDGYRRSMGHLGEERVYTLILDSFGLAAASGILIAVFVAVGMLVFIFEHKVRTFTEDAGNLVHDVRRLSEKVEVLDGEMKKSSGSVQAATAELKRVGPQIVTSSHDLSILANTLMGVPELRQTRVNLPVTPEAYYLRSWVSRIPGGDDPLTLSIADVVRAIAASYWIEESSDVSRFELVTNSRNYTAFLVAAVTELKKAATAAAGEESDAAAIPLEGDVVHPLPCPPGAARGTRCKVHFYTSTPVGPRSLLNWPMRAYTDKGEIHYHGDKDFVSSYMLFIRDLIKNDSDYVFHRRWIWTDVEGTRGKFEKFSTWQHYERNRIYGDPTNVLGVPVELGEAASGEDAAKIEKTLECETHGRPRADIWQDWINKQGCKTPVFPMTSGEFDNELAKRVDQAKSAACKKVKDNLPSLLVAAQRLTERDHGFAGLLSVEEVKSFSDLNAKVESVCGNTPERLPPVSEILMDMQKLDAALHLGQAQVTGDLKESILSVESGLRWLKWWELWQADYADAKTLPTFEDYFNKAFQTDGKPHSVDVKDLDKGLLACQETGPEFALLGLETNDSPETILKDEPGVKWLVALKSSISEPWDSGTISLVLRGDPRFPSFVRAITALCENAGLLKSTGA